MAYYRDNDNHGCTCWAIIIIIALIIGGIKSCTEHMIKGDLELPHFGSSKVSGGSGRIGTSNGYNVKYKNTTSPNYNSSNRDYRHTNSYPTEYREGRNSNSSTNVHRSNHSNSSHSSSSSKNTLKPNNSNNFTKHSSSYNTSVSNYSTNQSSSYNKTSSSSIRGRDIITKKCPYCGGKGYSTYVESMFFPSYNGHSCDKCGKTTSHNHIGKSTCTYCNGGQVINEYYIDGVQVSEDVYRSSY